MADSFNEVLAQKQESVSANHDDVLGACGRLTDCHPATFCGTTMWRVAVAASSAQSHCRQCGSSRTLPGPR